MNEILETSEKSEVTASGHEGGVWLSHQDNFRLCAGDHFQIPGI